MTTFLAAIQFDPNIRGVLVVMTGVIVLIGSVYLLLATNTGVRNGFLIAMAALFGWMASMGAVWWIYGIGLKGKDPSWIETEINYSRGDPALTEVVNKLPPSEDLPDPEQFLTDYLDNNPDLAQKIAETEGEGFTPSTLTEVVTVAPNLTTELNDQLGGWRILPESDSRRGDAAAAADATLIGQAVFGENTTSANYTVKDVFFFGGKDGAEPETVKGERGLVDQAWRRVKTIFQPKNPTLYAAVTVQKNTEQIVAPGEAPPPPQVDENAETITVVLTRNLGNKRLVPFLFTIFNGIIFAVLAWMLHNRDKRAMQVRADWDPNAAAIPAKVG